ncbi:MULTISPECIES: MFS transporter [unclassified Streptomyces]|uniref:MFS transporter n=1 Tax=unclassified Streptomyces TaxID=2593676 RepID=UPI0029BACBCC|nr:MULTISPECIES: MFS transporter [unclassified Streptomyces]MDX3427211.1 MFS transporter [Streptomyces sp. ME02-6985-2c]
MTKTATATVTTTAPSDTRSVPDPPTYWAPAGSTVTLLTVLGLLMVGQMYAVLAMLSPLATSLGTTTGQATWTATAFGFAYVAGFLFAGPLSDRYGSRTVITVGLVTAAVATLAVSAATNLPTAIALRSVQGLATASFAPSALSYVVHHIAPHRRASALAFVTSSFLASAIIMQVGVQAVVGSGLDWRVAFWISAALMALLLIPVRRVLRPTQRHRTSGGLLQTFAAMPRLLRRPSLVALYVSTMTLMTAFVAVYTAVTVAGPPGVAGNTGAILALRASALPALITIPLLGPVLQRLAAPLRIVLAFTLAAVTVVAGSLLGDQTVLLAIVLLLFVAGVAAAAPAIVETINANTPAQVRGSAVALYGGSIFVGASLGPQLTGALTGLGFGGILGVIAAALALGTCLALPSLRQHRRTA